MTPVLRPFARRVYRLLCLFVSPSAPAVDECSDDVRTVLDAVGSKRTALFGISEGGLMSVVFAATHPQRTSALS